MLQCVWHPNVLVVRMWLKVAPSAAGKAGGRRKDTARFIYKELTMAGCDTWNSCMAGTHKTTAQIAYAWDKAYAI